MKIELKLKNLNLKLKLEIELKRPEQLHKEHVLIPIAHFTV